MSTAVTQHPLMTWKSTTHGPGGRSPFDVEYGKLMMWFFPSFGCVHIFNIVLISYGALRFSAPVWPAPSLVFQSFPRPY